MEIAPLIVSICALIVSGAGLWWTTRNRSPNLVSLETRMSYLEAEQKTVRTAFTSMERDAEEMWDKCNRALARTGRLKALTDAANLAIADQKSSKGNSGAEAQGGNAEQTDSGSPSAIHADNLTAHTREDLLRIARQRGIIQ